MVDHLLNVVPTSAATILIIFLQVDIDFQAETAGNSYPYYKCQPVHELLKSILNLPAMLQFEKKINPKTQPRWLSCLPDSTVPT